MEHSTTGLSKRNTQAVGEATLPAEALLDDVACVRPEACVVEDWLAFFGHRWSALVLWQLKAAPRRRQDLMSALPGITPKVLSERLAGLQRRSLVAREVAASFPRAVRYRITAHGLGAVAVLDQLELWAKRDRSSEGGEQHW